MATINGSTNNSLWTFKLEATETGYSIANKTSTIRVQVYLGRTSSQAPIGGDYKISVSCAGQTQEQNGNISWPTYINGGSWLLLKTFTFTVSNTGNPTTISISSSMSSGDFTPSSASASGSLTLTKLHDAPLLTDVTFTETNQQLINVSVGNDYFVTNLSIKNIKIDATTSDDATITKYEILNGNKIYSSTTNIVQMNLQENSLETIFDNNLKREVAKLTIRLTDSLDGVSTFAYPYNYVIPYTKPLIEKTSTTIKRKTGDGTVLTDNKVLLNFVGTCYKGNDVIGNNNEPTVQYKIWNTTEPTSYTTLTTSNVANVSIKDYEISNILYTNTYNYKIKIYDTFTTTETTINVKTDKVPTGVSVWTEYKDRVDFIKATIGGENIVESGENDNGSWVKYYDGTMICMQTLILENVSVSTTWGNLYVYADPSDNWHEFPQTFTKVNYLSLDIGNMVAYNGFWLGDYGRKKIELNRWQGLCIIRPTSSTVSAEINVLAIGKWK